MLVARLDARLPDELPGPGSRVEMLMELVGAYLSEETEKLRPRTMREGGYGPATSGAFFV